MSSVTLTKNELLVRRPLWATWVRNDINRKISRIPIYSLSKIFWPFSQSTSSLPQAQWIHLSFWKRPLPWPHSPADDQRRLAGPGKLTNQGDGDIPFSMIFFFVLFFSIPSREGYLNLKISRQGELREIILSSCFQIIFSKRTLLSKEILSKALIQKMGR